MKARDLNVFAWSLSLVTVLAAFFVWGGNLSWHFDNLNAYQLFPFFGLAAFSLMWVHYVVAAVRKYYQLAPEATKDYFDATSVLVLVALLLHPGLFIIQLWRDGFGLPPGSYETYVGEAMVWVVMLGTVSWLAFMFYELRHWFKNRSWWKYAAFASDLAMLAIFYHGLTLGHDLHHAGWYQLVWYIYGVGLVASLLYLHWPTETKKT